MLSFRQFDFPPDQDFVPSKETKNFWLYTKKSQRTFGGVTLPGLFETVGYPTQMLAFFAVLLLEVVPTVYGVTQGVMWQAFVASIFVDIFLAIVAHLWHDKICRYKNELVNADLGVEKEALKRKINRYNLYTYFFYVLIMVSGVLKSYYFFDAYMVLDAIAGAVLVCYLLGAVLHIAYTGYFLYTSRFNHKIQAEYSEYVSSYKEYVSSGGQKFKDGTGAIAQPLFADETLVNVVPTVSGNHKIFKLDSDEKYYLQTNGMLTDNELANLIIRQPFNAQGLIARSGLKRQMEILETN